MLLVDFETRSPVDLKRYGGRVYAMDPRTEVICCGFRLDGLHWMFRNPKLYPQAAGERWPEWVMDALNDEHIPVSAHNAEGFDAPVWDYVAANDHDFPLLADDRWVDSVAICRVNGLPGKLDDAARAIGGMARKDHRGAALIRACSIPPYDETPEKLDAVVEYCAQDLVVLADLLDACRPLMDVELRDWRVNRAINERGVRVDLELAEAAVRYAEAESAEIAAQLNQLTNGRITRHTQSARIRDFVLGHLPDCPAMVRYKDGVKKYSIDKSARAELLDDFDLPFLVREVVELTDDGNRSSVAKFQKMLDRADPEDHRVRGAFVYAGAQQTLRFSARGLQLHNFRRDCWSPDEVEDLSARMYLDQPLDSVMDTLSKLLRPALLPAPGNKLIIGDWSAIEAMALPWLANSPGAEGVLDVFRAGGDVYLRTAEDIRIDNRQIGKVTVLSLGYGGALGAFQAMARNYGVRLEDDVVRAIVTRWRRVNGWAPDFWYALERAARRAIARPYEIQTAGRVRYVYYPQHLDGSLLCLLPGDTILTYPQVRIEEVEGRHGRAITAMKASFTAKADATEWPRTTLWHGLLAENATQGFCAWLLREALARLELEDGPGDVVSDVHDEIVLEAPAALAYAARDRLAEVMNTVPAAAEWLPLKAVPTIQDRYGKEG